MSQAWTPVHQRDADIVRIGDPVLARPCPEETTFDGGLALIAEKLGEAARRPGRFGVAAPQMGVSRRLFVFNYGGRQITAVNPRIVHHRGTWEYREGCLSMPGFRWPLMRPKAVTMTYQTAEGEDRDMEADEFVARGLQHELDHLDGILLPDRIREAWHGMTRQVRRQASRRLADFGVLLTPA